MSGTYWDLLHGGKQGRWFPKARMLGDRPLCLLPCEPSLTCPEESRASSEVLPEVLINTSVPAWITLLWFLGLHVFSSDGYKFLESKAFVCIGHLLSALHSHSLLFFTLLALRDGITGPLGQIWLVEFMAGDEREREGE